MWFDKIRPLHTYFPVTLKPSSVKNGCYSYYAFFRTSYLEDTTFFVAPRPTAYRTYLPQHLSTSIPLALCARRQKKRRYPRQRKARQGTMKCPTRRRTKKSSAESRPYIGTTDSSDISSLRLLRTYVLAGGLRGVFVGRKEELYGIVFSRARRLLILPFFPGGPVRLPQKQTRPIQSPPPPPSPPPGLPPSPPPQPHPHHYNQGTSVWKGKQTTWSNNHLLPGLPDQTSDELDQGLSVGTNRK